MSINSVNGLSNLLILSSPAEENRKQLFLKKLDSGIKKLKNLQITLPTNFEAYTPLQVAAALGELEACKKLLDSTSDFYHIDSQTHSYCQHPCGLALICQQFEVLLFFFDKLRDEGFQEFIIHNLYVWGELTIIEKIFAKSDAMACFCLETLCDLDAPRLLPELFDKAAADVQRQTLEYALEHSTEELFCKLWKRTPETLKRKGIAGNGRFLLETIPRQDFKDTTLFLLFSDSSRIGQIYLLRSYLEDPQQFIYLWKLASERVRLYTEDGLTWIHRAIYVSSKEVIAFLLKKGAELQIMAKFGITPFDIAAERRSSIGESLYRKLQKKDDGFSEDLKAIKLFGHQFSLSGIFEGFQKTYSWILNNSIKHTLLSENQLKVKSNSCKVDELIESYEDVPMKDPEILYARSQKKWAALMDIGWKGHRVGVIFTSTLCIKINTGTGECKGYSFFTIRNPDKERIKVAIKTLFENCDKQVSQEEGEQYFDETLDKELDLELIGWTRVEQFVGNCSWEIKKQALMVFLTLQELEENAKRKVDKEEIEKAQSAVKSDFRLWDYRNRSESIFVAVPKMWKYPQHFETLKILAEAVKNTLMDRSLKEIDKEFLTRRFLIAEPQLKDWKDPENQHPLYYIALKKGYFDLLVDLIKSEVEVDRAFLQANPISDMERDDLLDDLSMIKLSKSKKLRVKEFISDWPTTSPPPKIESVIYVYHV